MSLPFPSSFFPSFPHPHAPSPSLRPPPPSPSIRASFSRSGTLYDLLDLPPDVGLSDIKHAYRQLARKYHPDVCPSHQAEESTRRFIEIQEAYETLSDPRRRAIYDHAVSLGRGSAATGRMTWMPGDMEGKPSDWKGRWETQLSELKFRSSMKAQKTDSWAARVRRQNAHHNN